MRSPIYFKKWNSMLSKNIWSADKQKDFIYVTRFAYKVKLQIQAMFGIGKLDM